MDRVIQNNHPIDMETRSLISTRYKTITKAVNGDFWNSNLETAHSRYVGSYGRGTAINVSDLDVLIELPTNEYNHFNSLLGNGPSRLLQAVKKAIQDTYSRTDIRGDGQVVVVTFSDGMKFEVLPAFQRINSWGQWDGTYIYPNSNMGGNWLSTNPKAEQEAMKIKNQESNGLLLDTCKHMRSIRDNHFSSYHLPGIVIDSFVYHHIKNWRWCEAGEESILPRGTYEKQISNSCPNTNFLLTAPGSEEDVDVTKCIDVLKAVLNFMSND